LTGAFHYRVIFEVINDTLWVTAIKGGKWDGHSRWSRNVAKLGEHILRPRWSGFTLNELSERPDDVEDWHRLAVKQHGATSANHAARVLRALYKRRAKRDLSLSK
jgi:hypothetical protein